MPKREGMTRIDIQVYDTEGEAWDRAAALAGMSRHQWVRHVSNRAAGHKRDMRSASQKKRLAAQLKRIVKK